MSLYDDLDDASGGQEANVAGWGSQMKLLESQKQLHAKKALLGQKPRKPVVATMAPVVDLKQRNEDQPLHFNQNTGRLERMALAAKMPAFIPTEVIPILPSLMGLGDEYDPLRPNEYEEFSKRRKKQRREEERKIELEEREKRRKERHKNDTEGLGEMELTRRKMHEEDSEEEEEEKSYTPQRSSRAGAAIAPPTSLMEQDKVQAEEKGPAVTNGGPVDKTLANMSSMCSVASKIMARMGYRHGQGLGKAGQGMSTALQVEKTSKRGGKIIHEKDVAKAAAVAAAMEESSPVMAPPPQPQPAQETSNVSLLANPTKVILLRNMVGPGEVDDDLEPETAEECSKYGKVMKCVIFEVPNGADDEAVRIFLEFEKVEAAIKAVIDLNGRYFGGRIVRASFYNVDNFRTLKLDNPTD